MGAWTAPAFQPAFRFMVPCVPNAGETVGATCSATTSADALRPGTVIEGKRAIWALNSVQVMDGGPDGDPFTDDNEVFATQGLFVP